MIALEGRHTPPLAGERIANPSIEEERRLAFVGITRAMRKLHMTCAKYRTIRGMSERTIPSRFLEEIGTEHVVRSDQSDAHDAFNDFDPDFDGAAGSSGSLPAGGSIEAKLAAARAAQRSRTGSAGAEKKYPAGSRVRHPQFGAGQVVEVSGVGANARIKIKFRDVGTKTLVLEYARLTRLDSPGG